MSDLWFVGMIIFVLVVPVVITALAARVSVLRRRLHSETQWRRFYQNKHLRHTGEVVGYGTYDIRSFDRGKIWYVVEEDDEGLTIKGTVEEILPDLLERIRSQVRVSW